MAVRDDVLQILSERETAVSGEEMAQMLSVSRAAVWKAINSLRGEGYNISAATNRGYQLCESNVLSARMIAAHMRSISERRLPEPPAGDGEPPHFVHGAHGVPGVHGEEDSRLQVLGSVDSTNEELKRQAALGGVEAGAVVLADEQTAGKGRLGRGFHSPGSLGLYMSYLMKPRCDLSRALLITAGAAVACARAVRSVTGKPAAVKWVNDIYMKSAADEYRKAGGILTEAVTNFESGHIDSVIIGIGINCTGVEDDLPEDIRGRAISLASSTGKNVDRNRLAAEIIKELDEITALDYDDEPVRRTLIDEYKKYSVVTGRDVLIHKNAYGGAGPGLDDGGDPLPGIAARVLDITADGGLHVAYPDGAEEIFTTGEITLRI